MSQLLAELRRPIDLEVKARHSNAKGQPAEIIVAGPVEASVLVQLAHLAPAHRQPRAQLSGRSMEAHLCLIAILHTRQRLGDIGSRVAAGDRTGSEPASIG